MSDNTGGIQVKKLDLSIFEKRISNTGCLASSQVCQRQGQGIRFHRKSRSCKTRSGVDAHEDTSKGLEWSFDGDLVESERVSNSSL